MIRPKDAEKFVREFDAKEKARIAAGSKRATYADVEAEVEKLRLRKEKYPAEWGSVAEALFRYYQEMLDWDEQDLPLLEDLVDEEDEEDEEDKSKDAEAIDDEEKAKERDRKATHEDVKEYIRAIRYEWDDYWGDMSAASILFHKELTEMLSWDEKELPFLADIEKRMGL